MKRRNLLLGFTAVILPNQAVAEENPWKAHLVYGGEQPKIVLGSVMGTEHIYGLHVSLKPGWKTYWMQPGNSGIAPEIDFDGKSLSMITTEFPVPLHFTDAAGTSIGYHDEVVIIFKIEMDKKKPIQNFDVNAFMGMCNDICIPAKFTLSSAEAIFDPKLLKKWQEKLPQEVKFVRQVKILSNTIILDLHQSVDDVFLVGLSWLGLPKISGNRVEFTLPNDDIVKERELLNIIKERNLLYVVANVGGKGLGQIVLLEQ